MKIFLTKILDMKYYFFVEGIELDSYFLVSYRIYNFSNFNKYSILDFDSFKKEQFEKKRKLHYSSMNFEEKKNFEFLLRRIILENQNYFLKILKKYSSVYLSLKKHSLQELFGISKKKILEFKKILNDSKYTELNSVGKILKLNLFEKIFERILIEISKQTLFFFFVLE